MQDREPVARVVEHRPVLPSGTDRAGTAGRVLVAALTLFAQRGFHGTSIRDIGREIGLKPANLYEHFDSKEHVLAELVRIGHEELLRGLRTALMESGPSPADQLAALVRAHVRLHCEYALLAVVANQEMHALRAELVAPSRALRAQAEAMLAEVLARGIASGDFAPPHPFLAATAIGAMGMRVAHWYSDELALSVDEVADGYAELALRMVRR